MMVYFPGTDTESTSLLICGIILLGYASLQLSSTSISTADIETFDEFFMRCPIAGEVARVDADITLYFDYDHTAGTLACNQ